MAHLSAAKKGYLANLYKDLADLKKIERDGNWGGYYDGFRGRVRSFHPYGNRHIDLCVGEIQGRIDDLLKHPAEKRDALVESSKNYAVHHHKYKKWTREIEELERREAKRKLDEEMYGHLRKNKK